MEIYRSRDRKRMYMKHICKKSIKRVGILVWALDGGGMERVASQLSLMLTECGYEIYLFVVCYNRNKSYCYAGKLIACPCSIDISSLKKEAFSYLINATIIREMKQKYHIEAMISMAPEMNLINILSGTKDRKILTIHNCMSLRYDMKSLAYHKGLILLGNLAYKVVAVSKWCGDDLYKNYHIRKDKLQVIYNPAPIEKSLTRYPKRPILLVVGRLAEIKQQWHIIKAFKYVCERIPTAQLWIVGEGPEKNRLEKLAYDLGIISKVKFLGFVKDLEEVYSRAKVFALSSKSEAFPCVVVEALAHGLPIVASDFPGGIREAVGAVTREAFPKYPIDAKAGLITRDHDNTDTPYSLQVSQSEIEMGEAVINLMENDEIYRKKTEMCGYMIKNFEKEKVTKQWIRLLK